MIMHGLDSDMYQYNHESPHLALLQDNLLEN